jgi:hypothetical protein
MKAFGHTVNISNLDHFFKAKTFCVGGGVISLAEVGTSLLHQVLEIRPILTSSIRSIDVFRQFTDNDGCGNSYNDACHFHRHSVFHPYPYCILVHVHPFQFLAFNLQLIQKSILSWFLPSAVFIN